MTETLNIRMDAGPLRHPTMSSDIFSHHYAIPSDRLSNCEQPSRRFGRFWYKLNGRWRREVPTIVQGSDDEQNTTSADQAHEAAIMQERRQPALSYDNNYTISPRGSHRQFERKNIAVMEILSPRRDNRQIEQEDSNLPLVDSWTPQYEDNTRHQLAYELSQQTPSIPDTGYRAGSNILYPQHSILNEHRCAMLGVSHESKANNSNAEQGQPVAIPSFDERCSLGSGTPVGPAVTFQWEDWNEVLNVSDIFGDSAVPEPIPSSSDKACVDWFNSDFDQSFDFGLDFGIDDYLNTGLPPLNDDIFTEAQHSSAQDGNSVKSRRSSAVAATPSDGANMVQVTDVSTGQHACSICGNIYTKRKSLKRHHRDKHQNIKHVCDQCGKEFTRLDSLSRHKVEQHEETLSDAATDSKSKKIRCRICGSKVRATGLAAHQESKICRGSLGGLAIEGIGDTDEPSETGQLGWGSSNASYRSVPPENAGVAERASVFDSLVTLDMANEVTVEENSLEDGLFAVGVQAPAIFEFSNQPPSPSVRKDESMKRLSGIPCLRDRARRRNDESNSTISDNSIEDFDVTPDGASPGIGDYTPNIVRLWSTEARPQLSSSEDWKDAVASPSPPMATPSSEPLAKAEGTHASLLNDLDIRPVVHMMQDEVDDFAKHFELPATAMECIEISEKGSECPVCYNAVSSPAVLVQCEHTTCFDCSTRIFDPSCQSWDKIKNEYEPRYPHCRNPVKGWLSPDTVSELGNRNVVKDISMLPCRCSGGYCQCTVSAHHGSYPSKSSRLCAQCNEFLPNFQSLEMHARSVQHKAFLCKECGKCLSRRDTYVRHISTTHSSSTKLHRCEMCEKLNIETLFKRRDHLEQHKRNRHSELTRPII